MESTKADLRYYAPAKIASDHFYAGANIVDMNPAWLRPNAVFMHPVGKRTLKVSISAAGDVRHAPEFIVCNLTWRDQADVFPPQQYACALPNMFAA